MHFKKNDRFRRVLLINPPNNILRDSIRRISEPLGLLYVGTVLKQNGFDVDLFDMACEGYDNCIYDGDRLTYGSSMDELKTRLLKYFPDVVGVTCMLTTRERIVFEVCSVVKELMPDIPVVVGGVPPSISPEFYMRNDNIDYIIIGEGEFRFLKLLACLNNSRFPNFDGVAFKRKDSIQINPMTERIKDLDSIPCPDRTLVDMEKYIEIGTPFAPFSLEERVATILTTRGCPFRCNFCSTVDYCGRKLRLRSVDNIIGELRELRDKFDIREVQFVDDNMTVNRKFAEELFFRMRKLDFKFCTPTGLLFNSLDAKMIKLMAEAGAYQLTIAIESASQRVLRDIIHKDVNLDLVKDIIDEAHKYDIGVHGAFIVGLPGEKPEEIMSTLDFPFKVAFDSVGIFIACPLPGSDLYKECKEKGYLDEDDSIADFKIPKIHIPKDSPDYFMDPDELVKLVNEKTHEFNEWAKKAYPERWKKKFDRYLRKYPDQKEIIMGRVT